jgi:hypothetical protein
MLAPRKSARTITDLRLSGMFNPEESFQAMSLLT